VRTEIGEHRELHEGRAPTPRVRHRFDTVQVPCTMLGRADRGLSKYDRATDCSPAAGGLQRNAVSPGLRPYATTGRWIAIVVPLPGALSTWM
jgi:hypothetical protein